MAKQENVNLKDVIEELNKRYELNLSETQLNKAFENTKKYIKDEQKMLQTQNENNYLSTSAITAIALYGVLEQGGVRPVVQVNWGNQRMAIDWNSAFGGTGKSAIDNENRIDYQRGDYLGTEGKRAQELLDEFGVTVKPFTNYMQYQNFRPQPGSSAKSENEKKESTAPRPAAPGSSTKPY